MVHKWSFIILYCILFELGNKAEIILFSYIQSKKEKIKRKERKILSLMSVRYWKLRMTILSFKKKKKSPFRFLPSLSLTLFHSIHLSSVSIFFYFSNTLFLLKIENLNDTIENLPCHQKNSTRPWRKDWVEMKYF